MSRFDASFTCESVRWVATLFIGKILINEYWKYTYGWDTCQTLIDFIKQKKIQFMLT